MQRALKFSQVFGQTSLNSSMITRPTVNNAVLLLGYTHIEDSTANKQHKQLRPLELMEGARFSDVGGGLWGQTKGMGAKDERYCHSVPSFSTLIFHDFSVTKNYANL